METDKYIFFFGHTPNNTGLHIYSQWYPCKFTEEFDEDISITYNNAEQFMMAHKALLFGDDIHFKKILEVDNPAVIKQYGRQIKNFDVGIWNAHKFKIVTDGNRLKFQQNPNLMEKLLSTNNKTIVEASPYDKIWGIGLAADQAVNIPEKQWPGQNLLGKAIMVVRKENQ